MRVFEPEDFVMLYEIDAIDFQAPERFVELARGFFLGSAVDLRHEKRLVAITIAECFAHADLAGAVIVVPAVVQKVDATIDRGAHDADGQRLTDMLESEMPAANANGGNFFAGVTQNPICHNPTIISCGQGQPDRASLATRKLGLNPRAAVGPWFR